MKSITDQPSDSRLIKSWWRRQRINALRVSAVLGLPLLVVSQPVIAVGSIGYAVLDTLGILLVLTGVIGRFWCISYIGGRKSELVFQDGPYSICRHPLYLFSTVASLGLGLMLGSLVMSLVVGMVVFVILSRTAAHEELFLRAKFGPDYDEYSARVPRIIPNLSGWRSAPEIVTKVKEMRVNFQDALVFISFIPLSRLIVWARETFDLGLFPLI
jgi:protein-S-isoprenylcysteine O-methyltransferase Ste14